MSESDHSTKIAVKQNADGSMAAQAEVKGLLAHANHLEKWKKMVNDAPERILTMAEKEQNFRHRSHSSGQITATILIVSVLLLCGYMVYLGKTLEGVSTVLGALAILVSAAVYGKKKSD